MVPMRRMLAFASPGLLAATRFLTGAWILAACGGDPASLDAGPSAIDGGGMDAQVGNDASAPRDAGPRVQVCEGTAPFCRMLDTRENCDGVLGCNWTQCAGFAADCGTQRTEEQCGAMVGCSWNGTVCGGLAAECTTFSDPDTCRTQVGCTWSTVEQCRGVQTPCENLTAETCETQPGCRPYVPPIDAGPRDAPPPMCDPDGGRPEGCIEPLPPTEHEGCNPEIGVECDGDWRGTNPRTGAEYCAGCATDQCCVPRDGRFQCMPRDAAGACPAADIYIDSSHIEGRTTIDWQMFDSASCEIAEACVNGTGMRRLLRFDTWTPNIGEADLFLGAVPSRGDPSDVFEFSSCHGHFHFNSYAQYELLSQDACCQASTGHKQAFCLMDLQRHDTSIGSDTSAYGCGYQGIQRGWQDIYSSGLDCQFIDITDVPPGEYVLRIRVNVQHVLLESNYDNNEINVPLTIPPS